MNTKVKKSMKMAAAAVFIPALAVNVTMSLNNPFAIMSTEVLASGTGTNGTGNPGGTDWPWQDIYKQGYDPCTVEVKAYYKMGVKVGIAPTYIPEIGAGIEVRIERAPGEQETCVTGGDKYCFDIIGNNGFYSLSGDCVQKTSTPGGTS